jgi:hypothetical protein
MTEKLIPFTFKSTGIEVALKPVSNVLILEVRRSCPKPLPPVERIENADGTFREEPNPDAPAYADALAAWSEHLEESIRKLCIKRGVVLHLNDTQKAEVAELRDFMRAEFGRELDSNDRYVYVAYIAVGGGSDYADLVNAVLQRPSDPKSTPG